MAYSQEDKDRIVNTICFRISEGESLRSIVKDEGMPDLTTFLVWISEDQVKSKQYARAMELRADSMFEDMLDIADDSSEDILTDDIGNAKVNTEFVQRSRLRVDTRKWILSRMNPKKYGDKTDITTNGNDVNNQPTQIYVVSSIPDMKELEG